MKKKPFREPVMYHKDFVYLSIFIIIGVVLAIYLLFFSTENLVNHILNSELYGDAKSRSSQLTTKLIARCFGRPGLIIAVAGSVVLGIGRLYQEIAEYRRYRHKIKLYKEGIIKNVEDIYDDYPSKSFFATEGDANFRKGRTLYNESCFEQQGSQKQD